MTQTLRGAGGAPGIAVGPAYVHQPPPPIPPDATLDAFYAAQAAAATQLNAVAERQRAQGHADEAGIFEFQAMLAEDPTLTDEVVRLIDGGQPLGAALLGAVAMMQEQLRALDDPYMQERAADVAAVGSSIQRALVGGGTTLAEAPAGAIIVALDLTPAETAELPAHAAGFVTAEGGPTGHTAILARSRGVPAVVGAGRAVLAVADGTTMIIDGDAAAVINAPDAAQLQEYQRRSAALTEATQRRAAHIGTPGTLKDGRAVGLWVNIGRPQEAAAARANGAEGVGLFRTEFLFLDRATPPSEDEQYAAYRSALEAFAGHPVVVRTIDIGGDKEVPYLGLPREPNPFLGTRGLRLCMARPDLFQTQLRALLRAAPHGDLWVMLPMVSTPADLAWGRTQLTAAAAALASEGITHRADPKLGIMIETPAAAIAADRFARDAAFFSIGSNDLAQYTLAVDRGLAELANHYRGDDPAVYRLIQHAARAAHAANIPIGVCGELAGLPDAAVILAGLGIDELSMASASIGAVKERLASVSLAEAQAAAEQAIA